MRPEPRGILFDLDDTLYPLRRFVRSGFTACARYLGRTAGLDVRTVRAVLRAASTGSGRGRELQACVDHFGLGPAAITALITVIREHAPSLRLPAASRQGLAALRPVWRLGIVTNGEPARQARKIAALGLTPLVEAIVYADAHGDGHGKPQPEPFLEGLRRLGTSPGRTIFVGNDFACDVAGAHRVGMPAVHIVQPRSGATDDGATDDGAALEGAAHDRDIAADATIASLAELPCIAETLVPALWRSHVA